MKVGVIGTGYWGRKHVVEFKDLGMEVVAADLDQKKLDEFKDEKLVKTTTNYKELLEDPNVEVITICAPNKYHFSLAKECMEQGKHVLVEKPLAETKEGGEELKKIAEEKNVLLMVGHIYRFNNAIDKVKELIQKKELGKIREVKIQWINDEYAFQPDFDQRVGDRDVITDLAVHPYDIMHYLFGKNPDYIFCTGGSFHIKDKLEAVSMIGKMDDTLVQMQISWISPPKTRSLIVIGEEKSLLVNCTAQKIEVYEKGKISPIEIEGNNTIATELQYFLDLVSKKETNNKANGQVGVEIVHMLQLTKESIISRKPIMLN